MQKQDSVLKDHCNLTTAHKLALVLSEHVYFDRLSLAGLSGSLTCVSRVFALREKVVAPRLHIVWMLSGLRDRSVEGSHCQQDLKFDQV